MMLTSRIAWVVIAAAACAAALACDESEPSATNDAAADDGGAPAPDAGSDAARPSANADAGRRDGGDANTRDAGSDAGSTSHTDAGDAGAPQGDGGLADDAGPDAAVSSLSVAGHVLDAWTELALDTALVSVEDSDPLVSDTSNASGEYAVELAQDGALSLLVTRTGYHPTQNPVPLASESASLDVYAVAASDAQRQYSGLGLVQTSGTAVVFATLRDADGNPLEGIPLADVTLVDMLGVPVGLGPYYFDASGDLASSATLSTSAAFDGRARVGFLDCPAGEHELEVARVAGSLFAAVSCSADGATLVVPAE